MSYAYEFEPVRRGCAIVRNERALASDAACFGDSSIRCNDLSQLARQSDLAERNNVRRNDDIEECRHERECNGKVAGRLHRTDPADGRDVQVSVCKRDLGSLLEHTDEHREPRTVDTDARAPRELLIVRLGGHESLHFAHEGTATVDAGREHGAGDVAAAVGEEVSARVADGHEAFARHLEETHFLRRPEPVLEGTEHADAAGTIALEVQDDVDEVLEDPRARDGALFGDVPDEQHGDSAIARFPREPSSTFSNLTDGAGGRGNLRVEHRLDGIDDQYGRRSVVHRVQDGAELRIGHRAHAVRNRAEARRSRANLRRRFFPAHEQHVLVVAERKGELERKCGLSDAGLSGEQDDAARHRPPAEHEIGLIDAGRHPRSGARIVCRQPLDLDVRRHSSRCVDGLLDDGPPLFALRAAPYPARHARAAGLTGCFDLRLHPGSMSGRADMGSFWDTVPCRTQPRRTLMRKRPLIAVAALLLLVAACGREGPLTSELAAGTATPAATSTPAATATATGAPQATSTAAASAAPGGAGAAATAKPASQGGVNTPKDGRYVYRYKGEQTDPFNPTAGPQQFDGELTVESSHSGNVYTAEQTNTESPGRVTTRTRWEPTRILLLSFKTETAGGDFNCTYDPPILIAKVPFHPEKFPTQNTKGSGNACDGKFDINVERMETVKDATGRSWSTWRVHVVFTVGNEQFTNTTDQIQWFSPDLGLEIRTQETSKGEVRTPGGSQKFGGTSNSVLKSHP